MKNFELRRDRFNFFESFENPLLNLTFKLEVDNFLPYCKKEGLPPFHFFLFCLMRAFERHENFQYRIHEGKVFKTEEIFGSYTVQSPGGLFNYTRFKNTKDRKIFIENSLEAKRIAEGSQPLINTGAELEVLEMKKYIFITSIPWLDFTSIEHPVFKNKSADIPAVAWGKWTLTNEDKLSMPFSLQAHHGFVDALHMHELAEFLKERITKEIA